MIDLTKQYGLTNETGILTIGEYWNVFTSLFGLDPDCHTYAGSMEDSFNQYVQFMTEQLKEELFIGEGVDCGRKSCKKGKLYSANTGEFDQDCEVCQGTGKIKEKPILKGWKEFQKTQVYVNKIYPNVEIDLHDNVIRFKKNRQCKTYPLGNLDQLAYAFKNEGLKLEFNTP